MRVKLAVILFIIITLNTSGQSIKIISPGRGNIIETDNGKIPVELDIAGLNKGKIWIQLLQFKDTRFYTASSFETFEIRTGLVVFNYPKEFNLEQLFLEPSTRYAIRIRYTSGTFEIDDTSSCFEISDSNFVNIISPYPSSKYASILPIKWNCKRNYPLILELSSNSIQTYSEIARINSKQENYNYSIPDYIVGPCRIRFKDPLNKYHIYTSAEFEIERPIIYGAPSFELPGALGLVNESIKYGNQYSRLIKAIDPDNDEIEYNVVQSGQTLITSPKINASGELSFQPVFADLNKKVVIKVTAADNHGNITATMASFIITQAFQNGDANLSGAEPDITDAIQILEYAVGKRTFTAEQKYYANVDLSEEIPTNPTTYDASLILKFIASNYLKSSCKKIAVAGAVELGNLTLQNNLFLLPFLITNSNGINSLYTEINFNPSNTFVETLTSSLPQDWLVVTNIENGVVKLAAAGVNTLNNCTFTTLAIRFSKKETNVDIHCIVKLNDELTVVLNSNAKEIPTEFTLKQNYPNPFNPTTTINYSVAEEVKVSLVVYNIMGEMIKILVDSTQEVGYYSIQWDGTNDSGSRIASGIYILRLKAGRYTKSLKMNIIK